MAVGHRVEDHLIRRRRYVHCDRCQSRRRTRIGGECPQWCSLIDTGERRDARNCPDSHVGAEGNDHIVRARIRRNQAPDFHSCVCTINNRCPNRGETGAVVGDGADRRILVILEGDAYQHQALAARGGMGNGHACPLGLAGGDRVHGRRRTAGWLDRYTTDGPFVWSPKGPRHRDRCRPGLRATATSHVLVARSFQQIPEYRLAGVGRYGINALTHHCVKDQLIGRRSDSDRGRGVRLVTGRGGHVVRTLKSQRVCGIDTRKGRNARHGSSAQAGAKRDDHIVGAHIRRDQIPDFHPSVIRILIGPGQGERDAIVGDGAHRLIIIGVNGDAH